MMYITKSAAYYAALVILLVLSCDGCYTNYNNCQQYISATVSASSSNLAIICGAATTAMTCLDNDAANCPPGTVEPAGFTQIKTSINNLVISCQTYSCVQKVLECTNYSTEIANSALTLCPTFYKATKCYSELILMCPEQDWASVTSSLDTVKPMIEQLCGNDADETTTVIITGGSNAGISVRDPCPGVAVCLATLGSGGSLMQSCPNIPAFVTCVTTALNACGESSKLNASYSLADIQTLFTQSCAVYPNFASCQQTSICMQIDLPSSAAEIRDKVSDQTFWCNSLKSVLKCTTAYSQTCNQTATVTQTLNNLLNKVKVHCPDEVGADETTTVITTGGGNAGISDEVGADETTTVITTGGGNAGISDETTTVIITGGSNAGISVESSLMLVLVSSFVTSLY